MRDLRTALRSEFQDIEVRYAYAESFLNTKIAAQIKVLREQRQKTQAELAALCGTKQAGFSRYEDVNHSVWKTDTLWKIARALGVRVNITFDTFSSLLTEKERFSREYLQRPDFTEEAESEFGVLEDQTGDIGGFEPTLLIAGAQAPVEGNDPETIPKDAWMPRERRPPATNLGLNGAIVSIDRIRDEIERRKVPSGGGITWAVQAQVAQAQAASQ